MRRIYYKKTEQGAQLVRLFSGDTDIAVPGEIDKVPVVSIAPYAFSKHKEEEEKDILVYEEENQESIYAGEIAEKCGDNLTAVHLPGQVREVGNYAFYGCRNLRLFHASDRLTRMGSGVFTGCRLKEVELDFYEGAQSCLKEILTDIRYEIMATLRYQGGETAKVLFPEYYADAVENTPARIVETHYYGSGGDYRECFYRRELDFEKYDRMFILSQARDEGAATANLAAARLLYPYRLSEKAKEQYQSYIKEHMNLLAGEWIKLIAENRTMPAADPARIIEYCGREQLFTGESIGAAIDLAVQYGQAELAGRLMEVQRIHFRKKKKTFDL